MNTNFVVTIHPIKLCEEWLNTSSPIEKIALNKFNLCAETSHDHMD